MSNYYQQFKENKKRIEELKLLIQNDTTGKYKEEYEKLIRKNQQLFDTIVNKIEMQINKVLSSLMLEENLNFKGEIFELEQDFSILREIADQILSDVKLLKDSFDYEFHNIEPSQIKNKIKDLRKKIRDLKQTQIIKYNDRVNVINERIKDIRRLIITDSNLLEEIKGIEYLQLCDITISKYDQRNYLDMLNYDKLKIITYRLDSIENKVLPRNINKKEENLKIDISVLLNRLKEFSKIISGKTTNDDINKLVKDINSFRVISLMYFRQKLERNKSNISTEFYNQCLVDLSKIDNVLVEIEKNIDNKKVDASYQNLVDRVDLLCNNVGMTVSNIDGWCFGKITSETALFLIFELDKLTKNISQLLKEIDEFKFSEVNQKTNLVNKLEQSLFSINKMKTKVKSNVLPLLRIKSISTLREEIDLVYEKFSNDEVIRDGVKRHEIGTKLKEIKKDIDAVDTSVVSSNELDELKIYFEQVNNEYVSRCPRVIKQIKSAEKVYKEHDKTVLLASGLSIMALSFSSAASRLLIPAIILGNMLIADKDEMIDKLNNILAKVIRAKKNEDGNWIKDIDGTEISSDNITTILLKSVAITGQNFVSYIQESIKNIKRVSEKISLWEHIVKLKTNGKHEAGNLGGSTHGR